MADRSPTGILRSTPVTVVMLVLSAGLVVVAAYLTAMGIRDGDRDLRAYVAAPACPAAPTTPAECRWRQEFTVSGIRLTYSRSELYRAFLTDGEGVRRETFFGSQGPVLNRLDEGDRVTGTTWRGKLAEIAAKGATQDTTAAPADMGTRGLILALIAIPPSLLMMAACLWRLRRRTAPEPTPGMVATLGLGQVLFVVGALSPLLAWLLAPERVEDLRIVVPVWLALAVILAVLARIFVSRKRARAGQPDQAPSGQPSGRIPVPSQGPLRLHRHRNPPD